MTANKRVLCDVYKTRRKDEMYLYVEKKEGMARVPEELMEMFGWLCRHIFQSWLML